MHPTKKINESANSKQASKFSTEMRGASQTFFGSAWTEIIASNVKLMTDGASVQRFHADLLPETTLEVVTVRAGNRSFRNVEMDVKVVLFTLKHINCVNICFSCFLPIKNHQKAVIKFQCLLTKTKMYTFGVRLMYRSICSVTNTVYPPDPRF